MALACTRAVIVTLFLDFLSIGGCSQSSTAAGACSPCSVMLHAVIASCGWTSQPLTGITDAPWLVRSATTDHHRPQLARDWGEGRMAWSLERWAVGRSAMGSEGGKGGVNDQSLSCLADPSRARPRGLRRWIAGSDALATHHQRRGDARRRRQSSPRPRVEEAHIRVFDDGSGWVIGVSWRAAKRRGLATPARPAMGRVHPSFDATLLGLPTAWPPLRLSSSGVFVAPLRLVPIPGCRVLSGVVWPCETFSEPVLSLAVTELIVPWRIRWLPVSSLVLHSTNTAAQPMHVPWVLVERPLFRSFALSLFRATVDPLRKDIRGSSWTGKGQDSARSQRMTDPGQQELIPSARSARWLNLNSGSGSPVIDPSPWRRTRRGPSSQTFRLPDSRLSPRTNGQPYSCLAGSVIHSQATRRPLVGHSQATRRPLAVSRRTRSPTGSPKAPKRDPQTCPGVRVSCTESRHSGHSAVLPICPDVPDFTANPVACSAIPHPLLPPL
ncbi:hypothetical protein B0J13DRAFT_529118 [Dactylonectria estremocensis]|uniref:Secreted protein n=1 Tax=Dactylonectria estremocensis TaxID=1079267 RepID=A0A9P9E9T3_9HYPO|nr:hypothetical protein B0J13DRAFT_529118 [Dactylonectria estremocensis]